MRRLLVAIGVLALALPAAAGALQRGPGDGTLVVDNANGVVTLNVRGGIIGRFDEGTIVATSLDESTPAPVLNGCEQKTVLRLTPRKVECDSSGSEVRFRLVGGNYRIRVEAIGIDVSVVGRGSGVLDGSGFLPQSGRYSLNGGPYRPMPKVATSLTLGPLPLPANLGAK